nr:PREDICTED: uncharacterized protein LOC105678334 [Linepithema humile]
MDKMDKINSIKISPIAVCTTEEIELFEDLMTEFQSNIFSKFNIKTSNFEIRQSASELQKLIGELSNSSSIDIIFVINLLLPEKSIINEIDKISNAENEIIKEFTKIPLLLKPDYSRILYCSCKKNSLIFCMTGDKENIMDIVQKTATTMLLAAYLLQQVSKKCNIITSITHPHKLEDMTISRKRLLSTEKEESAKILRTDDTTDDKIIHEPKKANPQLSEKEALILIKDAVIHDQGIETEEVIIKDAFGRILVETAKYRSSVSPFTAATKCGCAVTEDKEANEKIDVDEVDAIPILSNEVTQIKNGTDKWVNKGECVSNETIAVIPAERDNTGIKTPSHAIEHGQNIKLLGSDIEENKIIVNAHKRIGPTEIALLTACGYDKVTVFKKLSIGILTIGNKLQEPGEFLKHKHLYDNNRAILSSLLKENCFDFVNPLDLGIVTKNADLITQKITEALENVDLLVTTGCSNNKNCLIGILKIHFKATLYFENVNITPGKSVVFASSKFENKNKYILCLPANPMSVFVTTHLFLLPLIKCIHRIPNVQPTIIQAEIKQKLLLHSRPRYVFATISWSDKSDIATVTCKEENSISKKLFDMKGANALLQLTPKTTETNKLSTSAFVQQIDVSYTLFEQNLDELEEQIIAIADSNTADIILILDLASKQFVITEIIDKIADTEDTIGKVFAEIPTFLKAKIKSLKFGCRNNKLIFFKTANKSGILKIIRAIADTIVLAAHLLRTVVRTIVNRPERPFVHVNRPEVGEDKILCTQHSRSSSQMEITELSTSFNLSVNENISTNQETCQSTTSVEEALEIIESTVNSDVIIEMEIEMIHIRDAFGRILCHAINCCSNVPPFLTATKRGHAVIANREIINETEMKTNKSNKFSSFILDSDTSAFVNKGECLPLGTTAVIPAQNVISFYEAEKLIHTTSHTVKYLENTRSPGSDIKKGDEIIEAYTHIGLTEINLLTACGCNKITVFKKLSIGVLTIGNKLQESGQSLQLEHSYDINRAILISLLKENCFKFHCFDFGITSKNTKLITQKITKALEDVDLLVTTGCSSDKDCLKTILKDHFEATLHFENVNMKPGKSTAFASCYFKDKAKFILCLPENPTSVLLTAYLFLWPLVNSLHFNVGKKYLRMTVKLEQKLLLHPRPRYVWATLSWREKGIKPTVKVTYKEENSISNKLSDIDDANALLVLPAKTSERSILQAASFVEAILIKFPIS